MNLHLIAPQLLPPTAIADELLADLKLPFLHKMLARSRVVATPPVALAQQLCDLFGSAAPAPVSAAFDGLPAGNWMRADPVHLRLQRDRLVLHPVEVSTDEAAAFCQQLNQHFSELRFFAPHPQRWYIQLDRLPQLHTTPLSQVVGENIRHALPTGADAPYWHQLWNEIQMVLHAHPLNAQREYPVNSVWCWGAGATSVLPPVPYSCFSADTPEGKMFAHAAALPYRDWQPAWDGNTPLLLYTSAHTALQQGDFADYRTRIQHFENHYAQPIWQALRLGKLSHLRIDLAHQQHHLTRWGSWAFWRKTA